MKSQHALREITEIESLREANKILKEHLEFLRTKLKKTEAILEMYIEAVDRSEKEVKEKEVKFTNLISLN